MYNFVYFIGAIIIFPIWLLIFLVRKDLRKEMLIAGVWVAFLAIIFEFTWFLKDYWNPLKYVSPINFVWQEIIFGIFIGGILSVVYEFFFSKKIKTDKFNLKIFFVLLIILILIQSILANLLKINSIYANITGFLSVLGIIIFIKPNLAKNAIISGLASLVIAFAGYLILLSIYPNLIQDWWRLDNISGIFVWKIPIEEIIWFASFGSIMGPLYKFWHTKTTPLL